MVKQQKTHCSLRLTDRLGVCRDQAGVKARPALNMVVITFDVSRGLSIQIAYMCF